MMNPNSPDGVPPPQSTWWVETWSSQITTGLALFLLLCGVLTTISLFTPVCIIAGLLQLLASGIILSVEAPSFVPFLAFARPVGIFVENKPHWFKAAFYGAWAVIPFIIGISLGCAGFFFILGFIATLAIAALYGKLLLGKKADRDDMRFQAGAGGAQQYSPTSP